MDHKGWLIYALLAHRFGGHVGTIGFEHQSIEGDEFGGGALLLGILEGDHAGERDVEAFVEDELGLLGRAAETVEDDLVDGATILAKDFHRFFEGFSAVDDDRQIQLGGDLQVLGEDPSLVLVEGEVVMIVEAGLADGDDLFVPGEGFQLGQCVRCDGFGIVGVDSDGGVEVVEALGELDGLSIFLRVGADGYPGGDAGLAASCDDGVNVTGQIVKCQMAMCVNQFHCFQAQYRFFQRIRVLSRCRV